MAKNQHCGKTSKKDELNSMIMNAKINFNESIGQEDKVLAIDEEAPFIVLVKKDNSKICWVVDFLLGERIKNYNAIPKVKVDDYLKVLRIM